MLFQLVHAQQSDFRPSNVLGGSFNFNISDTEPAFGDMSEYKVSSFDISPYFGKKLNPGLILGLRLDLSYLQMNYTQAYPDQGWDPMKHRNTSFAAGMRLFSRHSLNPRNRLQFYLQPSISYARVRYRDYTDSYLSSSSNSDLFAVDLACGALYQLNDKFNLFLRMGALGYSYNNRKFNTLEAEHRYDSFYAFFFCNWVCHVVVVFGLDLSGCYWFSSSTSQNSLSCI